MTVARTRPQLTRQQEADLAARAKAGDRQAREALIESAMPLATHIAGRFHCPGYEPADFYQTASLAVVEAVDEFEPDRGRFVAFALCCVRRCLKRLRGCQSQIRVPLYPHFPLCAKAAQNLIPLQNLRTVGNCNSGDTVSREAGPLESAQGREQATKNRLLADRLLAALPEREAYILRRRFIDSLTLKEIANEIGLRLERVFQIQNGALRHLRKVAAGSEPDESKTGRVQPGPDTDPGRRPVALAADQLPRVANRTADPL